MKKLLARNEFCDEGQQKMPKRVKRKELKPEAGGGFCTNKIAIDSEKINNLLVSS